MATKTAPAKRPRIDPYLLDEITSMHPDKSFERAVNATIQEAYDARTMLAESILDLEGPRPNQKDMGEFNARRDELAIQHNTVGLIRILRLRLRDRGINL